MVTKPESYWSQVGDVLNSHPPHPAWRAYCDDLYRRWLTESLGGRQFRRALKTDLFDEAVGAGAVPAITRQLFAIDLAPPIARLAFLRHAIPSAAADVRHLPFPDASFDLIISLSSLDHFDNPAAITTALRELHRTLVPGGTLAITLDNLSHPAIRLRNSLSWPLLARTGLVPYYVGATLTLRKFHQALTAARFRVIQSTTLMHSPRPLLVPLAGCLRWPLFRRSVDRLEFLARLPSRCQSGLYLAVIAEAIEPEPS